MSATIAAMAMMATMALAMSAASCATTASAPRVPVVGIRLALGTVSIEAIDIDSVRVTSELRMVNDGDLPVVLEAVDFLAVSGGLEVQLGRGMDSARLDPGNEASTSVVMELDAPPGEAPLIPLCLKAIASYTAAGGAMTASVDFEGDYPRIMAPELTISSIRILKDELVNTKLMVAMSILNRNAFGLSFSAMDYRLYGGGRYWASGSIPKPVALAAASSTSLELFLTMNFTDMDRSLLDRVIKLSIVDYRLSGAARVSTGLEFLPEFKLPFDMSGRVEVVR